MNTERRQETVSPVTAWGSPDTRSPTRRLHIASSPLAVGPCQPHWALTAFSKIDVLSESIRIFHALGGSHRNNKQGTRPVVWLFPYWLPSIHLHRSRATNWAWTFPGTGETMRNIGAAHKGTSSRSQRPCGSLLLDTESQHVQHKEQTTNPSRIVRGIRVYIENLHASHGRNCTRWNPVHPLWAAHSNHGHCGVTATHPSAPPPNKAAQHSSGNASCISTYMLEQGLEIIRKCFSDRTKHAEHWTILQRPKVITRTEKTTLHAWHDDRNSRRGWTRLHLKRDCHHQTTDSTTTSTSSIPGCDTSCVNDTPSLPRPLHDMLRHLHSYVRCVVIWQDLSLRAEISRPVILKASSLASHLL